MPTKIAISTIQCKSKIPQGSPLWGRFNTSFRNREVDVSTIMNAIYDGFPITTQLKQPRRATENYLLGQHLALDFDNEDDSSTIEHLAKDNFISKHATFIHTTISHTKEAPRARVFFVLDEPIYQARNYTLASAALLWMFGTADRQCKDAVRFYYGAPNCDMEFLGGFLDIPTIKRIITNYQNSGAAEKKKAVRKNYAIPPSQQEVASALKYIPAMGIDYDEWLQVLMAIHSEFGDGGLVLADSWAQGKPNEVSQKFRSFRDGGNASGQITIATVFGLAKKYGWRKELSYGI